MGFAHYMFGYAAQYELPNIGSVSPHGDQADTAVFRNEEDLLSRLTLYQQRVDLDFVCFQIAVSA